MKVSTLTASIAAALAVGFSAPSFANKPDGLWHGAIGASAAFASGNTRSTSFSAGVDASKATEADKISLYATALYGKTKIANVDITTAELLKMGGRYDWNINQTWFAFGALDLERDALRALDLRTFLGGGIGAHLIKDATTTFDVFAGVGFGRDKFKTRSVNGAEALIGEESTHKLSETMSFKQKLVIYPSFKNEKSDRATFDAQLAAAINKDWNLTLNLNSRYVREPAIGTKSTDTLFLVGVSSKF
jgi:putative salt-induced outer membrane protein